MAGCLSLGRAEEMEEDADEEEEEETERVEISVVSGVCACVCVCGREFKSCCGWKEEEELERTEEDELGCCSSNEALSWV